MHIAGREKMKSGFRDAEHRMVHHGGSFEHFPAHAWAQLGNRYLSIEMGDDTTPAQLVAKCEAMLRNGAGWRIQQ
jgi:hypothetical protein